MLALWGISSAAYIPAGTELYLSSAVAWTGEQYLSAYFYNTASDGNYVPMTAVAGETGIWRVAAPAGGPWTYVVFRSHNAPVTAGTGMGTDIHYRTGTLTWGGYQSLYEVNCDLCATEGIVNIATGAWSYFMPLPAVAPQQMGQTPIDSVVCHTLAGTGMTLSAGETGGFMHSQWFGWQDGAWTRLDGTPAALAVTLPADTAAEAWYWFTGFRRQGANLIDNGDFERGNISFTTDYTYRAATADNILYDEGYYTVTDDVIKAHSTAKLHNDHTTGSGMMMAVNGDRTAGKVVWEQTVTGLKPYTSYVFSAWVANWDLEDQYMAILEFSINGQLQGDRVTPVGQWKWTQLYSVWNSGADTEAVIRLVNWQNADWGNDFAVDDITLTEVEDYSVLYRVRFRDCSPEPEPIPDPVDCYANMVYAKWTDVLFCDNHDSVFVAWQWYGDSVAIQGATKQFLYKAEGMGASVYHVMARKEDGTWMKSCPMTFGETPRSVSSQPQQPVIPAAVRRGQPLLLRATQGALDMTVYDMLGNRRMTCPLQDVGTQQVELNLGTGMYVVTVRTQDGMTAQRMLVW